MDASTVAGYSGTPLYRKLGIDPDSRVCVLGGTPGFFAAMREAPFPIECGTALEGMFDVIVYFTDSYDVLAGACEPLIAALDPAGGLWIAWPKKASKIPTDLTENRLRDLFLPNTPMVDNKVCAIDAQRSGLRFVRRKAFR